MLEDVVYKDQPKVTIDPQNWSLHTLKLGGGGQANFGNVKITKAKKADEQ